MKHIYAAVAIFSFTSHRLTKGIHCQSGLRFRRPFGVEWDDVPLDLLRRGGWRWRGAAVGVGLFATLRITFDAAGALPGVELVGVGLVFVGHDGVEDVDLLADEGELGADGGGDELTGRNDGLRCLEELKRAAGEDIFQDGCIASLGEWQL